MKEKMELPEEMFADLVITNGAVLTVDKDFSIAEALAVRGEWIVKVGSAKDIKPMIGKKTRVIDLKGRTIMPGLIDTHMHLASLGQDALTEKHDVDARNCKSIDEILEKIKTEIGKSSEEEWIRVRYTKPDMLDNKRRPDRWDLDKVSPNNPVVLRGHPNESARVIVNSYVLNMAGFTKETPSPPGGLIEKDPETGEPTGALEHSAQGLLLLKVPSYGEWGFAYRTMNVTKEQVKRCIKAACNKVLEKGITTVHEIKQSPLEFQAYQEMRRYGELPVRLCFFMICGEYSWKWWSRLMNLLPHMTGLGIQGGLGDNRIKILGIKLYIDGLTNAQTIATYHPFKGKSPDHYYLHGVVVLSPLMFKDRMIEAQKLNLQVEVHADGERAIDIMLDGVEWAQLVAPVRDPRHKIAHAVIMTPKQIERAAKLGAIPEPHPLWFETGNVERLHKNLPDETRPWYLPIKSLFEAGIKVPGSSDGAGAGLDSVCYAVTRKNPEGEVFNPEQRISVEQSIIMHTYNGAYAGFEEDIKGSLEPGKLADMIVLAENPLEIDPDHIKDLSVEMTFVGGELVHQK